MTKRRGLGKGLEALIPAGTDRGDMQEMPAASGIVQVLVEAIDPNPHQPRALVDPEELTELAASIREHGLIQPVIATRSGGRY